MNHKEVIKQHRKHHHKVTSSCLFPSENKAIATCNNIQHMVSKTNLSLDSLTHGFEDESIIGFTPCH